MITEDYVSLEVAKLLKEKGFIVETERFYDDNGIFCDGSVMWNWNVSIRRISAPTLQMAMKWLREEHKLSIEPYYDEVLTWVVDIKHIDKHTDTREFETVRENWYKTYEEACEAAIKYCIENLI